MSLFAASFKQVALRRLFSVVNGATPDSQNPDFWGGDVPWVTPEDLSNRSSVSISDSKRTLTEAGYAACGTTLVAPGAIVLSTRAPIGNLAIAATKLCTNQGCKSLVPLAALSPRFFAYQLSVLTAELNRMGRGTTFLELSSNELAAFKVSAPSPGIQECIANLLDVQTARIDSLIAEKELLVEALLESGASQVLALVTGQAYGASGQLSPEEPALHAIPAGWKLPQLARLVSKLTNGFVGPTRDILVADGIRYLQSLHIKNGRVDFSRGEYFVDQEWSDAHSKSILNAGDVLIVQTGDIGQTAVVTPEFVGCNCHALIIATPRRELVDPQYLELVLRSAYGRACFSLYATGALHPHLNCSNIRDIRVPLPKLSVQHEIVQKAVALEDAHRELTAHVHEHIDRLREYRSSLISAAVTGQLDLGAFRAVA